MVAAPPPAHAVSFDLTSDHCTGLCGPQSSFGTVTLTQVGANVDVLVTLNNNNKFIITGNTNDIIDFNSTVAPTLGTITSNPFAPNALTLGTNIMADGFGTFGFGIVCNTCAHGGGAAQPGPLEFNLNGVTIANLTSGGGTLFVVDIISGTNGNTGYVDATGTPTTVPEPATIAFLGTGLVALGVALRRRRVQG
jgi:PEP-CTERM motif-containing protein